MKTYIFIVLLLAFSTPRLSISNDKNLSCVLTADNSVYKVGQIPVLKVKIFNNTKKEIYLIGSLDGSDVQWRYPHCYFSVDKPKPDTIISARCGNMNPLTPADFVLVKPRQNFNPYDEAYDFFGDYTAMNKETFRTPGVYKIKFHYSTNSENISDFLGERTFSWDTSDSVRLAKLFKLVPRIEITSNEIEIKIEE